MQGRDLGLGLGSDGRGDDGGDGGASADSGNDTAPARAGALFGIHGGHVNVTDGRYVYMRAADDATNSPLEEFTLMPTRMRARFSPAELAEWQPAEPFGFTKGLRTMRTSAPAMWMSSWQHGTLLFDLETDPGQEHPFADDEVELRMIRLLLDLMRANEAPASQFQRLGLPATGAPDATHLHVRLHAGRAADVAEPLPATSTLRAADLLELPLVELLQIPAARAAVERHAPDLGGTELVAVPAELSVLDLAAHATIPAAVLRALDDDLAALTTS